MTCHLNDADVLAKLESVVREAGSAPKAAKQLAISQTLLSMVRRQKMPIPPKVLTALSLERCPVSYREKR